MADEANTVSVGSTGNERKITHVAKGTAPTDAVNVQQLNDAISSIGGYYGALNKRISKLDTRVDRVGAMASAISSLQPLAYDPQALLQLLAGVGSYDGQTAEVLAYHISPVIRSLLNWGWPPAAVKSWAAWVLPGNSERVTSR